MQETCNNCFGLKKCNTTLHQVKKGKDKFSTILASDGVILEGTHNNFSKHRFLGAFLCMHIPLIVVTGI